MLADITNKPENQRYSNVQEYFEISELATVSNENHPHNTTVVHSRTDEIHSKSPESSSSSSSSSSSGSSSSSSSDSSDTDSSDEQNKTQGSRVQVLAEKQSEQTNVELATTDIPVSQENEENTAPQEEKKKGRKRKRDEESWKQNKAKSLRNAGKQYINKKNKEIKPRSVQPPCGDKCRLKCCEKISEDQRQTIFNVYWKLGRVDAQSDHLFCLV